MPAGSDRQLLEARSRDLRHSLSPAKPQMIAARVAQMFLRFPSSRIPESQWEPVAAVYVADLQDFPLWAIDRACKAIVNTRGETSGAAFAPSSVELRAAVMRELKEPREELAEITKLLTADVYHEPSDDEKARVQQGFAALLKDLKNTEPYDKPRPGLSAADRAATKAMGAAPAADMPPVKFSEELVAKMAAKESEGRTNES